MVVGYDPLHAVHLRLDRAEEHLGVLNEEAVRYSDGRPYVPVVDGEPKLQADVVRWPGLDTAAQSVLTGRTYQIVASQVRPPPDRIALLLSDIVHSLRSALDNLAWTVVRLRSAHSPVHYGNQWRSGKREPLTAFPLFDKPPMDKNGLPRPLLWPYTTPEIETFLNRLQPYTTRPAGLSAALVRDLSNTDKHRALRLAGAVLGGGEWRIVFPNGRIVGRRFETIYVKGPVEWREQRLEDGTKLGAVDFVDALSALTERPGEMQVNVEAAIQITLDEPGTPEARAQSVTQLCQALIDFVRFDVVHAIVPML